MNTRFSLMRFAGTSWPGVICLVAIVLAAPVLLAGCGAASQAQARVRYHCPMHPNYVSDRPGDCPICGMRLVPMENSSGAARQPPTAPGKSPGQSGARQPDVVEAARPEPARQDRPQGGQGQSMPGMPGMPASPPPTQPGGHTHSAPASPGGLAPVDANADQARLVGVRTIAAAMGTLTGTIRAVGTVVTPETGVRQVTTRVAGWVQKLYVNSIGRPVRAGEPLFELYSPELLASQEEYLHARQVAGQFANSSVPEVQRGSQDLVAAARRRLELYDVPAEFLARLDETGKAQRTVTFPAPFGGYVMEKTVVEGQRIEPGMNLMTIADLSHVWVTAQLHEAEAGAARPGRTARITLPYDDTVKLTGRLTFVYPTLDVESRTIRVRFELPNPRLALKPGMFVNVELDAQQSQGVIVPDSALIDTGTRQVVFVETAPGHFEPRDVQAGLRNGGNVILLAGIRAGEQVAVAASFLLDSESRLRGAIR
jgi:Cu(I)/Ag(I) efflux system membrane fusion protein